MHATLDFEMPPWSTVSRAAGPARWRDALAQHRLFFLYANDEMLYLEAAGFIRSKVPGADIHVTMQKPPLQLHRGLFKMTLLDEKESKEIAARAAARGPPGVCFFPDAPAENVVQVLRAVFRAEPVPPVPEAGAIVAWIDERRGYFVDQKRKRLDAFQVELARAQTYIEGYDADVWAKVEQIGKKPQEKKKKSKEPEEDAEAMMRELEKRVNDKQAVLEAIRILSRKSGLDLMRESFAGML